MAKKPRKKRHILLTILLCLFAVVLILAAITGAMWLSGRRSMSQQPDAPAPAPIHLPTQEIIEELPEVSETVSEPVHDEVLDEYTFRHNGKLYRQKQNVKTFLVLGIDRYTDDNLSDSEFRTDAHADVILWTVMDLDANKTSFVSIPRDTIVSMSSYDKAGNYTGKGTGQLALAFRYGDGKLESCRLVEEAVSGLLYDIPIDGTGALFLDSVGAINDVLGGVTLTPISTFGPFVEGQEKTLTRQEAVQFIRHREGTEYGNLNRMENQKVYFRAMMKQMASKIRKQPSAVLDLYRAVADYLISDLKASEIVYLGTQAAKTDFSGNIRTLPGEVTLGEDNYARYDADTDAVIDLILSLYYEEVG